MILLSAALILCFGFAVFCRLADYNWWGNNRRAVVPKEDKKQNAWEVAPQTLGRGAVRGDDDDDDDDQEQVQTANQAQNVPRNQVQHFAHEVGLVDVEKIMPAELPPTMELSCKKIGSPCLGRKAERGFDNGRKGVQTDELEQKNETSQTASQEVGGQSESVARKLRLGSPGFPLNITSLQLVEAYVNRFGMFLSLTVSFSFTVPLTLIQLAWIIEDQRGVCDHFVASVKL